MFNYKHKKSQKNSQIKLTNKTHSQKSCKKNEYRIKHRIE